MADIKTATSAKEPFRVEQQPDGSFDLQFNFSAITNHTRAGMGVVAVDGE